MMHGPRLPAAMAAAALLLGIAGGRPAAAAEETQLAALGECRAESARLALRVSELEALLAAVPQQLESEELPVGSAGFIKNGLLAFSCVVLAALAAGLTMGLVSLEPMEMEIIVNTQEKDIQDVKERQKLKADQLAATRVLPLIQDHHRLLVTLLLMNSIANEALPLFLDQIVPSWMAVILSVTLVLMFGEIIPSAVFTGSEQLRIAAKFAGVVHCCRLLLTPIAWPIAKALDCLLGEDHKGRYNFAELRAIVGIHAKLHAGEPQPVPFRSHDNQGMGIITTETPHNFTEHTIVTFIGTKAHPAVSTKLASDGTIYFVKPCEPPRGRGADYTLKLYKNEGRHADDLITFKEGELTSGLFRVQERDELKIMHGVMSLTHMTAGDAKVPLSEVYMLEANQRLTKEVLQDVLESGFSRVPVYSVHKHNLRGFILVKKLIVVSPEDDGGKGKCIESLGLDPLVLVPPEIPMLDLLNKFQEDRCHLGLVTDSPKSVLDAWEKNIAIPPDVHMSGIITLEDIIEKLLQEDIEDEHDARKQSRTKSMVFDRKPGPKVTRRHSENWSSKNWKGTVQPSELEEPLLP